MLFEILVIVSIVVVGGLLAVMIRNPFARNLGAEDFSELIRGLLIARANGSRIRIDHQGSEVWFAFERRSGSDKDAVLTLRIPRMEWSERLVTDIRRIYESHGFEFTEDESDKWLLGQVVISVDNIWARASGSRGAYAGRLFIEAIGLPQGAKFKTTEFGEPSKRALENDEFLNDT